MNLWTNERMFPNQLIQLLNIPISFSGDWKWLNQEIVLS